MKKQFFLLVVSLLVLLNQSHAQNITRYPFGPTIGVTGNADKVLFAHPTGPVRLYDDAMWTGYNGNDCPLLASPSFSSLFVNRPCLTVDPYGVFWVGTGYGLASFDADELTWSVEYQDSESLPAGFPDVYHAITAIYADSNEVWIGRGKATSVYDSSLMGYMIFKYGIVSKLENGVVTDYLVMPDSTLSSISSIAKDHQGNLWAASGYSFYEGSGVYKFDGTTWTNYTSSNSGLLSNKISDIAVDNQNNLYFATELGVSKFDGTTWTFYDTTNSPLPTNIVWSITVDASNNLWFGLEAADFDKPGGAAKFDGTTWTIYKGFVDLPSTTTVYDIFVASDSIVWLAADGGIIKIEEQTVSTAPVRPLSKLQPQFYPNPVLADDDTHLILPEASSVRLVSTDGRTLRTWQLPEGTHPLSFDSLPNGVYFLTFDNPSLSPIKVVK